MRFRGRYRFLSNFYTSRIVLGAKEYPTVEHAYQAWKTLDPEWFERIRTAGTPGKAKRLGRQAPRRQDWESVKVEVMRMLLRIKFARGTPLAERLLATVDKGIDEQLIEENTWDDTFWGVCEGIGANRLGELLMEIREDLRLPEQVVGDIQGGPMNIGGCV